ncbi:hypothetical protein O181_005478 [Austropuccinia psidii MF-1]|uniref:Uncharacterized protein n=1 Tax=Austropuccinia psidii MF-1 TaxID=1389203 RepID=A0A9Q3BIL1_9BASI|nr:hypothetical protein [Austropuccinia psidii MF-1]
MQVQEDVSYVERINQRMLEMQQEFINLLKKEGKRKESSFTTENSQMEETTIMPKIFRKEGSPSPFSRPMESSTPFNSKKTKYSTKEG